MAVRFDANTDFLSLAPSVVAMTNTSLCFWAKRIVDTNNWATAYYISSGAGGEIFIETDSGGDVMWSYDLVTGPIEQDLTGPTLTLSTWIFIGYVRTNTSQKLYWGTEAGGALSTASAAFTVTNNANISAIRIGNDIYSEPFNGEIAYARHWTAQLSDGDMTAEYQSAVPVRTANLYGDWRLAAAATAGNDSSGGGFNMTINGALTDGGANPTPPSGGGGGSTTLNQRGLATTPKGIMRGAILL